MIRNENGPDICSFQNEARFPAALIYSHSAMRADVRLGDPSRSPAPCLCGEATSIHQGTQPRQIFRVPAAVIVTHSSARSTIRSGFVCQTITVATPYVQINKGGNPFHRRGHIQSYHAQNDNTTQSRRASARSPFFMTQGCARLWGGCVKGLRG